MSKSFLKLRLAIFSILTFIYFSAHATTYPINVTFSGKQEVPANGSTATGTFVGTYNDATDSLIYTITFSGLSANSTAAHFHGWAPPGISAGVLIGRGAFPTGVMSGTFTDTVVLTAGQEDSLKLGLMYFNIHTAAFPGGEIRAQLFLQNASFVLPDVTCPADITADNTAGLCSASVTFAATAAAGTPTPLFYYRIGNTAITSPHVFPVGATRVIATALNSAGYDSCSFLVTVKDVQAPTVTCPANITKPNDPGQCGAIVTYPAATASDNCSGVTITYSKASGSFFAVGTTTVTVTATDGSNNAATCSFTVTVNDVEPPVIHDLVTDRLILWPPNHKLKNVMVSYSSTDNCPGPISCSITVTSNEAENGLGDGDTAPDWMVLNDHLVKLRAERAGPGAGRTYSIIVSCTDQYGNTGRDTTTVLVPHSLFSAYIRNLLHQRGINGAAAPGTEGMNTEANKSMVILDENDEENITLIRAYPNPSRNYFNINIETTNNADKVSVRILDVAGRVVEIKSNISGSQVLKMGSNLRAGIYFAEIRQGNNMKTMKLLKQE